MTVLHPIFVPKGYTLYTLPTERYMNYLIDSIKSDNHGSITGGPGRIGKTEMVRCLSNEGKIWLSAVGGGIADRAIIPATTRRSDGAFFAMIGKALRLSDSYRPKERRKMERIVNYVLERCGGSGECLFVLFLDNAHNISASEFGHLIDLDDAVEEAGVRLYLAMVRQSDTLGEPVKADFSHCGSHISGRWLQDDYHELTGLCGLSDVAHAVRRYQHEQTHEGKSFVETFAPNAVATGWEIETDAPLIMSVVDDLRQRNGLSPNGDWPMKTFTSAMKFLLTEIAGRDSGFAGFRREHISAALAASGYLRLELVHAGVHRALAA
jgi:hypothetical protein